MAERLTGVREAEGVIGAMPIDTFLGFHRELQYAFRYWTVARRVSDVALVSAAAAELRPDNEAIDMNFSSVERAKAITESPLYNAARARIRKEMGAKGTSLPADFTGWIGLEELDKETIEQAIGEIANNGRPVPGMLYFEPAGKNLDSARRTIDGYGIKGIFVESPDLVTTFHEHWGQK